MTSPIIFIAHQKIKQGMLEEYKRYYQEVGEWMQVNKPHTAAHIAYINEEGSEASVVHIFQDIEGMENHVQNLGEMGIKALTLMEIIGFDVYGTPSKMVFQSMLKMVGPGAKVNLRTEPAGGFIRLEPAQLNSNLV